MEILNLAGPAYDFGDVVFAVLQDCEHKRRALLPDQAAPKLMEIARAKLAEIEESYREAGGTPSYWEALQREVLETSMPQYINGAVEQTRLERSGYDVWRGGDPAARATIGVVCLILGGLIVAAPFIPIFEDTFAFALALAGFFYPELKRVYSDYRHTRLLNRLVVQAEKYQRDPRIHYVSNARIDEELRAATSTAADSPAPGPRRVTPEAEAAAEEGPPPLHPEARGKQCGRQWG
jgi:hypothetical protein